jgi:hypothetical protein
MSVTSTSHPGGAFVSLTADRLSAPNAPVHFATLWQPRAVEVR